MKFKNKKLNIIQDGCDAESVPSGKKNRFTKFYSIYVFKVLTEVANKENPLRVQDVVEIIKDRYKTVLSIDTVQDYIRNFKNGFPEYNLEGTAYEGYYLESKEPRLIVENENILTTGEITYLCELLSKSKTLTEQERYAIKEKLCFNLDESIQDFLLNRINTKKGKSNNSLFVRNKDLDKFTLEEMPQVIDEQLQIDLCLHTDKNDEPIYKRFNPYYIYFTGASYFIVGCFENCNIAKAFYINQILDYSVVENKYFYKKPIKVNLMDYAVKNKEMWEEIKSNSECKDYFIFPSDRNVKRFREISQRRIDLMTKAKSEHRELTEDEKLTLDTLGKEIKRLLKEDK